MSEQEAQREDNRAPSRLSGELEAIWKKLLNVSDVRDVDNFVEMGGDSVAAAQCVALIDETFGVEISVAALLLDDADFGTLRADLERLLSDSRSQ